MTAIYPPAVGPGDAKYENKLDLNKPMGARSIMVFLAIMAIGLFFVAYSIYSDVTKVGTPVSSLVPFLLLAVALLIALGFEFVNGFHDTANAVATVIYTRSLVPEIAVVWSGFFNFLGVLTSSGAVAFGIISLLPVELILQVGAAASTGTISDGSAAGFAMIFALLIAAILWNLGTWWLGLPASSSHTMIGSVVGVGVMNALMRGRDGTSGVDTGKVIEIGEALLLSPVFGFVVSAALLYALKALIKRKELFSEPVPGKTPPLWIRGILILTCTLVSFFHGSNDGQKGMGLIMLILIGTVPTAYALNRSMPADQVNSFISVSDATSKIVDAKAAGYNMIGNPRPAVTNYVSSNTITEGTFLSVAVLIKDIAKQVQAYGSIENVPATVAGNTRNDMYLTAEAVKRLAKDKASTLSADDKKTLGKYSKLLDASTKFIPTWVKVAVALALGLGTMIGWKRIVVTVGEKIGKTHLTYGQGASAEMVAALTIGAADGFGLPVSTTHVLSSGIAGTMAANGSGIQWATLRSIALAWVLTLPCAMAISGSLFFIFSKIF